MADNNSSSSVSGGVGFAGLLTLVFVVAKIGGWIDWSWWVVFLPIIISTGIALVILAAVLIIVGIAAWLEGKR